MPRKLNLEVANFICRFGETAVLMDLFDEVVRPAFLDERERKYRDTTYILLNTSIDVLEKDNPESVAIVGRIVKNTVLKREQIFDRSSRDLKKSARKMETSPSSIFVLLLASHRLLLVREQADSPTFAAFRTTTERFLRQSHLEYLNSEFVQLKGTGQKVSKKSLKEKLPIPDVEVVPIVSPQSLEEFVKRFKLLTAAKFTILSTNNENDNESFLIDEARRIKDEIDSKKTVIAHQNNQGLKRDKLLPQLKAARQGNTQIQLDGFDNNGNELKGDNQNFNVRHPLPTLPESMNSACRVLFAQMKQISLDGVVKLQSVSSDIKTRLTQFIQDLKKYDASHRSANIDC